MVQNYDQIPVTLIVKKQPWPCLRMAGGLARTENTRGLLIGSKEGIGPSAKFP
jgi:hypothetical protein